MLPNHTLFEIRGAVCDYVVARGAFCVSAGMISSLKCIGLGFLFFGFLFLLLWFFFFFSIGFFFKHYYFAFECFIFFY